MNRSWGIYRFVWLWLFSIALTACGRDACPSAVSPTHADEWGAAMAKRTLLTLNPEFQITIKRDVHFFDVSVSAEDFSKAFHAVMIDPNRRFGLIRVDRDPSRRGLPFASHERFQGRYVLPSNDADGWLVCKIENDVTSDYGEIEVLKLDENPQHYYKMSYRYLSGSPMAGSSTFEVQGLTDKTCRVTQTFVYQENDPIAANSFTLGVLKLHDQVVYSQISQSAAKAGGAVTETDLLGSYKKP